MINFLLNILLLILFLLFLSLFIGCNTTEDVGCVPIHVGAGYDDNGMREIILVEEMGCPRE